MKVYPMTKTNEAGDVVVVVFARATGPGGIVGDAHWIIEQGQTFGGYAFEHWLRAAEKNEPVTLT